MTAEASATTTTPATSADVLSVEATKENLDVFFEFILASGLSPDALLQKRGYQSSGEQGVWKLRGKFIKASTLQGKFTKPKSKSKRGRKPSAKPFAAATTDAPKPSSGDEAGPPAHAASDKDESSSVLPDELSEAEDSEHAA